MNIIFDKKTLKVISLIENEIIDEEELLRSMFPNVYKNLSLWKLKSHIDKLPKHLTVSLDSNKNPFELLFKGKSIYKVTKEEQEQFNKKTNLEREKLLFNTVPRVLRSCINNDLLKFWQSFHCTLPEISNSIKSYKYFSDEQIIPVMWSGPYTDAGGYANMNREITFRLHNYHILTKAEVWPTAPQISPMANYYLSKYNHLNFRRLTRFTKVHGFTPHPVSPHNGRLVFFTMMETETLHPEFVRLCNKYPDEIWVPSRHNKRVFVESGVTKNICVMPLGIDSNLYRNEKNDIGIIKDMNCFVPLLGKHPSNGINKFRYITLFGWSYRKGTDILIRSFVEEFTDDDDVALIICSRHSGSPAQIHQNVIYSDTLRYARQVRKDKYPQILLYPHVIPEKQMPSIYKMGNVFCHFSRGEGFSLPQIEAAASGLPVISCNNTGMSEYLTQENAYLVTTDKKEICSPEMHWITSFYHNQLFPKLGREQIEQAKKHMRYVLNNYQNALEKAKIFKKEVFEKYTWDKVTERVAERLGQISKGF